MKRLVHTRKAVHDTLFSVLTSPKFDSAISATMLVRSSDVSGWHRLCSLGLVLSYWKRGVGESETVIYGLRHKVGVPRKRAAAASRGRCRQSSSSAWGCQPRVGKNPALPPYVVHKFSSGASQVGLNVQH
jgi:hypothetical protein